MIRLMLAACVVHVALSGQVLAQQGARPQNLEELNKQIQENLKKVKPGFVQTRLVPLDKSLEDLLNNGWTVSSGDVATGLVLKQGNKWVACMIDDGQMFGSPPSSHCVSLN